MAIIIQQCSVTAVPKIKIIFVVSIGAMRCTNTTVEKINLIFFFFGYSSQLRKNVSEREKNAQFFKDMSCHNRYQKIYVCVVKV